MNLPPDLPSKERIASLSDALKSRGRPDYESSELTRPLSEWDRRDREGKVGTMVMVGPLGSRYDEIDWSK